MFGRVSSKEARGSRAGSGPLVRCGGRLSAALVVTALAWSGTAPATFKSY